MILHDTPPAYFKEYGDAALKNFEKNAAANPFFKPVWFDDIFGATLDERTDGKRIEELLIGSYAALAPKKLLEEAGLHAGEP